ncbi:unnamed protein product [Zymoseptoria tritici ST99CH_1A5]|uniref:Uncharacterized protein n=2 Tax=Zymoseptoria tritici TaxID=1047171 RepID=A0A2H1H922_ZYMTR|nr:unnamed protein product [Zymoseptoria tritici ST99CH_1E4]SMY30096.1 unnamed protein product [Zymoseptoria tritici ST99CH_1A5]
MIKDGVLGTTSGPGLQQLLAEQGHRDDSQWFRAARMYNGGQIDPTQLLEEGCCTKSYASDIANRLKGWVDEPREDPKQLYGLQEARL